MLFRIPACLLVLLTFPSFASALPVVAGFGNSITCWDCNDGSYLVLLEDWGYIDSAEDASLGESADLASGVLSRLDDWLDLGNTADVLILLAGTPDTYLAVGGWKNREYDPLETLGNIDTIIDLVLGESIPLILVAPPPVLDPCGTSYDVPTCGDIDTSLANLAVDLALLAGTYSDVQFLDLYAAFTADPRFGEHPGTNSLYRDDGLHPRLETGDTLIASLLVPMLTPEPSTALLVASGLLAFAQRRREGGVARRSPSLRPPGEY